MTAHQIQAIRFGALALEEEAETLRYSYQEPAAPQNFKHTKEGRLAAKYLRTAATLRKLAQAR